MTRKMIMYTQTVCPKCDAAKAQIAHIPAEFKPEIIYVNVDEDENSKEYMMVELESMSTPTFEFRDEIGKTTRIVRGFEMGEIQEELGL
ncbi:glutaredoxin family protein [Bacillus wiedmannii]|uniref:glutaredoxin family protein n=1 Tax=Bacillus wiedmannii TaxID=1890302 RepID=UPI000BF0AA87|nr:glutaredoxin domain-containing protein [Bacillus wiedmannii]PEO36749.1 hypothetical protein CN555_21345 [Bacillus wiedmannii]